jgi:hypothetical protein
MLLAPARGFVFLAAPKTASTAIENAFLRFADGSFLRNPFKHMKYSHFQERLEPFLEWKGFPRSSYEVVCVSREPVDRLNSWWRFLSREKIQDPARFAGDVTFEQFARTYLAIQRGEQPRTRETRFAQVGRMSKFIRPLPGKQEVDRIFRYENLDLFVDFLSAKVGKAVDIGVQNVSPKQSFDLSEECERDLRAFFEPETRIHEHAVSEPIVGDKPRRRLRARRG